ncbi:unnamed protein product [Dicrocoelium dendriticum]|nr:unnamed protein product [Dicrocoelium dendriticum]
MPRSFMLLLFFYGMVIFSEEHNHVHEPPHFKYSREANLRETKSHRVHVLRRNLRTDSPLTLWLETSSAVLLISAAPFFILFLLPDLNNHQGLLKVLLAFAAGGLLGDAFLHLIPHAINSGGEHHGIEVDHHMSHHKDRHDHTHHTMVGLSVVAGIFVFLVVEKLVRLARHGHFDHIHVAEPSSVPNSVTISDSKNKKNKKGGGDDHTKKREKKANGPKHAIEMRASGYLNLAADSVHNFADGLAIGASFLISRNVGMITTLTVLLHELPHEMGDYAILIQSGCSARKAMLLQLITAMGAVLGASLSLLIAGVGIDGLSGQPDSLFLTENLVTGCVLPFTAGGFIYIAMTSVLPDLLNPESSEPKTTPGILKRLTQSIAEIIALTTGVTMMAALGALE